jgi:hypothetical protein
MEGVEDVEVPARMQVVQQRADAEQRANRGGTEETQLHGCNEEPEEEPNASYWRFDLGGRGGVVGPVEVWADRSLLRCDSDRVARHGVLRTTVRRDR